MRADVKYSFERSALDAYNALRSKYRRMWVLGVISRAAYQARAERLFRALEARELAIAEEFRPKPPRIRYDVPQGIPSGVYQMQIVDTSVKRSAYGDEIVFKLKVI
jgi:hypothetical protein